MSKLKALVPEYLKDFTCIGSNCEETCCKNWKITVDKETYKKYKRLKNNDFHPLKDNKVIKNKKSISNEDYAIINLDKNNEKYCPFLNEDLLCNIYTNLGEDYMCDTCKTYPREFSFVDDELEISLVPSCPEAARKILYSPNGICFEHIELDYQKYMDYKKRIYTKGRFLSKNAHKYFWNIRIASITILQNRNIDIVSRLTFLGILYKKVNALIKQKNYQLIDDEIIKFVNTVEHLNDNSLLDSLSENKFQQALLCKEIILGLENISLKNKDSAISIFINSTIDFFKKREDADKLLNEYNFIIKNKIRPFFDSDTGSMMIENYLVNKYFLDLMPFTYPDDMWKSLIVLCGDYFIIKSLMLRIAKDNDSIKEDDFFSIVCSVSRSLTHNSHYYHYLIENIENWEPDTLGGIYTLINN